MGDKCKLDSCVGIGCHFKLVEGLEYLRSNWLGLYDFALSHSFHKYAGEYFRQFDELAAEKYPER